MDWESEYSFPLPSFGHATRPASSAPGRGFTRTLYFKSDTAFLGVYSLVNWHMGLSDISASTPPLERMDIAACY
jgi:hypothetical protein